MLVWQNSKASYGAPESKIEHNHRKNCGMAQCYTFDVRLISDSGEAAKFFYLHVLRFTFGAPLHANMMHR